MTVADYQSIQVSPKKAKRLANHVLRLVRLAGWRVMNLEISSSTGFALEGGEGEVTDEVRAMLANSVAFKMRVRVGSKHVYATADLAALSMVPSEVLGNEKVCAEIMSEQLIERLHLELYSPPSEAP